MKAPAMSTCMTWSRLVAVSFVLGGVSIVSLAACSPGTADKKDGALTVSFQKTSDAIATDTLELRVYDASTVDGSIPNDCLNLISTEQNSPQTLPKPIYDSTKVDTCNFFTNKIKPFDMGFGPRSFLVVGQRNINNNATDYVIGCTLAGIGDVSNSVNVELSLFDTKAPLVPDSTKCASLSDRCDKGIVCY
jgi:hypothetical protein